MRFVVRECAKGKTPLKAERGTLRGVHVLDRARYDPGGCA